MRRFLSLILLGTVVVCGCERRVNGPGLLDRKEAPLPQVTGSLDVTGLSQPVRVVRDRWGIPHITAQTTHDLFLAQGFVQAQDRLFQMDLWRRSAQGRLAQVLGPNFVDRDAMTRRMQYHGDLTAEWASYGPDARGIADAFVAGINAWVAVARQNPPREFLLAGWLPQPWVAEDLLNRTDAFLASGDAALEALRAELVPALGEARTSALLPGDLPRGLAKAGDIQKVGEVLSDALRRVGTTPFFSGLAAPFAGSNAWALDGSRTATGAPLVASDPHRPLTAPSQRYLVHLQAPGWSVIGATSPWLPGVVIGHNDHVAWGMAAAPSDTQDLYIESVAAVVERVVDPILIKGRGKPFAFERQYTANGVVIGSDRERGLVFTLKWNGFDAGAAGELGALTLDRATSRAELRDALSHWKMPVVEVVYADAAGVGHQVAGGRAAGVASGPGALPGRPGLSGPAVIAANESVARTNRLRQMLSGAGKFSVDDLRRQQHDVTAWVAEQLVPRLGAVHSTDARVEAARQQLLAWDRRVTSDSQASALYVAFERILWRKSAEIRVPAAVLDDYLGRAPFDPAIVLKAGNALLLDALTLAVQQTAPRAATVTFTHPLAITPAARRLFNIGPFEPGGYDSTVNANFTRTSVNIGASFRQIADVADWDRSVATSAPGQAEQPASPHYSDLAKLWAAGEYFPLSFSDRAIQANAESTLTLRPR